MSTPSAVELSPRGVVDLRGPAGRDLRLSYPFNAAVVVAGLPGSGKSTLLRAWSGAATVVDPRVTRTAFEARMPPWLPYAAYRPWARLRHMRWTRRELRLGRPLLIHDCGSRGWMRRWLARTAHRAGRPLHMVVLDVGGATALSGQRARRRTASRRVFAVHRRGLARLLRRVDREGPAAVPGFTSLLLLDRDQRERTTAVRFAAPPSVRLRVHPGTIAVKLERRASERGPFMSMIDKLKGLIKGHPDQARQGVEKAGDAFDARTRKKYQGQVDTAQQKINDQLGNQPPAAGEQRPPRP